MSDPYGVLGVKPDASDDEIKRAYRDLARKYHPDSYQDNPLADLAEEKMKEVNEAYDAVNKQRSGGGGAYQAQSQSRGSYQQQTASTSSSPLYGRVRQCINQGDMGSAEQLLRGAPSQDGEWHFLTGSIAYRKGWLDEATQHYQMACNLEPSNAEYRQALSMMRQGGQAYRPYGYGGGGGMDSACSCCETMMCINCLCGGCN